MKNQKPLPWRVGSISITCPVCKETHFYTRKAQLNTAALSFMDLDFLNKSAHLLICSNCTHIQWFAEAPVSK